MSVGSINAADAYSVAVVKKEQDLEKIKGEGTVRLIEAANADSTKRVPPPDSTFSVVA